MDFLRHYYVGGVSGGSPTWGATPAPSYNDYVNKIKDLYSQYQSSCIRDPEAAAKIAKQIADLENEIKQNPQLSDKQRNDLLAVVGAAKQLQSAAENLVKAKASGDQYKILEAAANESQARFNFQAIWSEHIGK